MGDQSRLEEGLEFGVDAQLGMHNNSMSIVDALLQQASEGCNFMW